ncbi:MAG: ion transporter [Thiothrix sp.]|nr:ion transporter [Thiothrix sp.]HPQ97357.1 ion transporter [Thiolinea sp.]
MHQPNGHTLRHQLYQLLEQQRGYWGKLLELALIVLIIINVIAIIVESEAELHERQLFIFYEIEYFSIAVFSIEYLTRLWVSVEASDESRQYPLKARLKYLLSPTAIIDLLAILPFYLGFFIQSTDLRILRSLRLLRMFKLTRYSRAMLLRQVIVQEMETMVSAIVAMLILILVAACGLYLVEGHIQPEAFGSIPRALWWATVTLTTVGYGDTVPATFVGKLLSSVIMIFGIAVAALPSAILASGLINELDRRREHFRNEVLLAYEDGKLDFAELRQLEKLRIKIGVSRADARIILEEARHTHRMHTFLDCPHCNQSLVISHPGGHVHIQSGVSELKSGAAPAPVQPDEQSG